MHFSSLRLTEFRNFSDERVQLRPRLNFFVGDNGQGKTNLIEAIHLLSRGTSFRPTETASYIRHSVANTDPAAAIQTGLGHEFFTLSSDLSPSPRAKIAGRVQKNGLSFDVQMSFQGSKRTSAINGKRSTYAELSRSFPCVLFSPESLSAIKEGPEQRRLLADELLLIQSPAQTHLLHEFQKCLRSRNRLLRRIMEGEGHPRENDATLTSLNTIFLMLATHLTAARLRALNAIRADLVDAMRMISDEHGDISVEYLISEQSALGWSEERLFDTMRKRQQTLASQEIASGTSLVGPHKHDIKFLFAGNDSRFYCSQGQQRALILSFKIAQIVYHSRVHQTYPVLLLDDVLSELDQKKRVNLMRFLEGISAQVLITSTDLTWSDQFAAEANSVFTVNGGRIAPLSSV